MLQTANDYRDECAALNEVLAGVSDEQWEVPTQFKSWTATDVIGHLHYFDVAAGITLDSREKLQELFAGLMAARSKGHTLVSFTREWLGDCRGAALRRRWFDFSIELAERFATEDPGRRVAWGGPDMSVRSCVSARQMETWSHGQALFDLFGVERVEADRLRNIAVMGVNTFAWSFVNRKMPVPETRPFVRLVAPSGALWEWNTDETENRISGSAVDFCRVVTQTRNIADTDLEVVGDTARQWMSIAQCFAGPPEDGPAPGARYCQDVEKQ